MLQPLTPFPALSLFLAQYHSPPPLSPISHSIPSTPISNSSPPWRRSRIAAPLQHQSRTEPTQETKWDDTLYKGFGGWEATVGGHHTQPMQWIKHFYDCPNHWVRRLAFLTYWLNRYAFNELHSHSIKPYLFELAIKLA